MPMSNRIKLTKANIENLQPKDREYSINDTSIVGFQVRVRPSGHRAYVLRYRGTNNRQRKLTIGQVGSVPLIAARKKATELLGKIASGVDPLQSQEAHSVKTMTDLWIAYSTSSMMQNAKRTQIEKHGLWRRYISRQIGHLKVSSIDRSTLKNLLNQLSGIPTTSNRVRSLLSVMFSEAIELELIQNNPCVGIKLNNEKPRETYLSQSEAQMLFDAADADQDHVAGLIVKLAILTGARKNEILSATWDQFSLDTDTPVWKLDATMTKQSKPNIKPLNAQAADLLRRWKVSSKSGEADLVFPSNRSRTLKRHDIKKAWSRMKIASGLDLETPGLRFHDLRHTFASFAITGSDLYHLGKYMGHTSTQTTQRYAHLTVEDIKHVASHVPRFDHKN